MKRFITLVLALSLAGACAPENMLVLEESEAPEAPIAEEPEIEVAGGRINDLDIVVFLDRSGSMQDDTERVAQGIVRLRADIEDRADSYRIWFTVTDPAALAYVGPFGPEDSDVDLLMAPELLSYSHEKPLGAVWKWYQIRDSWASNERDQLLILVTDEDDKTGLEPAQFSEWLDQVKEDDMSIDLVSVGAYTEGPDGCGDEVSQKLIDLAEIRGNKMVDLCEEGWEGWLAETSFLTEWRD